MRESRIYSRKVNIDPTYSRRFYNERAKKIDNMECPYTAVLLGDQNSRYADEWNKFEKKSIFPKLKVDKSTKIIDIGCGMGRWAEFLIPEVQYYCGTDFSEEMIEVAKKRCNGLDGKFDFNNMSFQEFVSENNHSLSTKFNRLIICGVCMYINDDELVECYKNLLSRLEQNCIVYLTETVAVETRLTLDQCPSQALKTNYDAIYRTPSEYNEFYKVLLEAGFEIKEQGYLPHLNKEKDFSETDRWYTILERN